MRNTIQDKTLVGKSEFERRASTFGVKINRYDADDGIFAEGSFRSEIDNTNQTIIFCGVGFHHQNDIVKRKTQTLTLGYITLLLNAKIY